MLTSFLRRWTLAWARPLGVSPALAVIAAGAGLIVAIFAATGLVLWQLRTGMIDAATHSVVLWAALSTLAVFLLAALLLREMHARAAQVLADRRQAAALAAEKVMLEAIATSSSPAVLDTICRAVEAQIPDSVCSILFLDADRKHLRHGAAPGLPKDYNDTINGIAIGPKVGSCGTAAYFDRRVIVSDIMTNPLWTDYRDLAATYGLRACWSTPIHSTAGKVLGTFAIYYREPRAPTAIDLGWTERATHLAGIAIERQQAEQAMAEARDQAQRANRAKSVFLANMSHELRTPLNAIIGFSEGLGAGIFGMLSEDQQGYVRDIREAGAHLLNLINDLLDLSRIDAGKLQLDSETVDLEPILDTCARALAGMAATARVTIELDLPHRTPRLRADPTRVRQIVTNLLSNAIKFSPTESRVVLHAELLSDGRLCIAVEDSSVGMTPAEIAIALEPFRQVDGSPARRCSSAGLGLPLAKQLVELHGGSLEIDGAPGQGTTVRAIFPADRVWPAVVAVRLPVAVS